jgi:hypothetical protein
VASTNRPVDDVCLQPGPKAESAMPLPMMAASDARVAIPTVNVHDASSVGSDEHLRTGPSGEG